MDSQSLKKNEIEPSVPFNSELLSNQLNNTIFKNNLIFKDMIGSTNVFLKRLAQKGSPEGTVVIAEEQSAGLGRLGRQWFSKKGENLLFSVLLRPGLVPEKIFVLTMIFALAGIDALQQVTGLSAMIKWPNDLYVGDKKLGGILTEFNVKKGLVQQVVLGMGLNVNWNPTKEQKLPYPTTSIFSETHKKISRERLVCKILKNLDMFYHEVLVDANASMRFHKKWSDKSAILGKSVVIETGKERVHGKAANIDPYGALTLIKEDGHERKFVCGDVCVKMNFSES